MLAGTGPRESFRCQEDVVTFATQRTTERGFGITVTVGFGSIEIVDAQIAGMVNEILIAAGEAVRTERDIRDLHATVPERRIAAHARFIRDSSGRCAPEC